MPKLDDLKKAAAEVGRVAQKVVDKVPTDAEVLGVVAKGMEAMADKVGKIDKDAGRKMHQWAEEIKEDKGPKNLEKVIVGIKDFCKKLKDNQVFGKLKDFLGAAVDLMKSSGGDAKDRAKAFVKFTEATVKLSSAIAKVVGKPAPTPSR